MKTAKQRSIEAYGKKIKYEGPFAASYPHKYYVNVLDSKTGKTYKVNYGHADYEDYTQHGDKSRRQKYLDRALAIKNRSGELTYKDPFSANFWAVRHLWKYYG